MSPCQHENQKKVYTLSSGVELYWLQCQECGNKKRISVKETNGDDLPLCDESIRDNYYKKLFAESQKEREQEALEWWAAYDEYLTTQQWKDKRAAVLKRANFICEGCGKNQAVQAHHLTYAHVGDEFLFELVAVCLECHGRLHERRSTAK